MQVFVIRRILQTLLALVVMSLLVFVGVFAIGDPVAMLIDPKADQVEIDRAMTQLGLDQPWWLQYLTFVGNTLKGDLGRSFIYNVPAIQLIAERLPATLELAFSAMVIAVALGVPLGIIAGLRPYSAAGRTITALSILGFSLPSFWIGLMLILIFSVYFGWLPSIGRGQTGSVFGFQTSLATLDGLSHLVLPAVNLALFKMALLIRLTSAGVREASLQEYVRFARAKGLSRARIVFVHICKVVSIPVITVIGLEFGSVVAFAVVTETIFAWPGTGRLIISSINNLDRPVVVAYLLVTLVMFAVINLTVDLLYGILDPRVRYRGGST